MLELYRDGLCFPSTLTNSRLKYSKLRSSEKKKSPDNSFEVSFNEVTQLKLKRACKRVISQLDRSCVRDVIKGVSELPDDGQVCLVALTGDWSLFQERPRPVIDCQLHSPSSKEQ